MTQPINHWNFFYDLENSRVKKLASAYLFWGNQGLGQQAFAEDLSAWLLCDNAQLIQKSQLNAQESQLQTHEKQPNTQQSSLNTQEKQQSCGKCISCNLISAGTHPDRLILSPESDSTSIKVDTVRQIREFSQQKSHGGRYRVTIISPAEAMNTAAANALLKILEEPFENSIFLLVSYNISGLLPTILSRCQKIYFPPLEREDFEKVLLAQRCPEELIADLYSLSHGSPDAFKTLKEKQAIIQLKKTVFSLMNSLRAKKITPIDAADSLKKESKDNLESLLDILLLYAHQWGIRKTDPTSHHFYDQLLEIKRHLKNNINPTIWLESLFYGCL